MGITNLDRLELGGIEIMPLITNQVTKTVGAGLDFETFHEAMTWVCNSPVGSNIMLVVSEGIHKVPLSGDTSTSNDIYTIDRKKVIIQASNLTVGDHTIITVDSSDPSSVIDQYGVFFTAKFSEISFRGVQIDPYYDGYVTQHFFSGVSLINCNSPSLWVYATFKNLNVAVRLSASSTISMYELVFDTDESAIYLDNNSLCTIVNSVTMTDCIDGFTVTKSSKAVVPSLIQSNVSTPYSSPLNEIQYDGSCISSGAAALTLKA